MSSRRKNIFIFKQRSRAGLVKNCAGIILYPAAQHKIISFKISGLTLNYLFLVCGACAATPVMSKCTVGFETDNVCEQF